MFQKIEQPTNCPSCGSSLEQVKDQLFCRNSSCSAQQQKRIEHFAKTLKIKGLGPVAISKLGITNIAEIYEMDISYIKSILGDKLGAKLAWEIEASKKATLEEVLPAFGVPLVGKTLAKKISLVVSNIYEIDEITCKKAGLGPKATDNLLNWLETEFPLYEDLGFSYWSGIQTKTKGIVCISGKLKTFKTKAEAEKVLKEIGYIVNSNVSKDVTLLINESGVRSSKTVKAEALGIPIITNINQITGN